MVRKISFLLLSFFVFFLIFAKGTSAQVVINEMSTEGSSDWIELFSSEDTDISGWILRDTTGVVDTIGSGVSIGPSSSIYYLINVSNRLNNSGDVVSLYLPDGSTKKDEIPYGDKGGVCTPTSNGSIGRYPDANQTIERFFNHTQGASNATATLDPCATPTPVATSSPTPSPSPTSVPTSTATTTPRPSLTPTKTPTPTKTQNSSQSDDGSGLSQVESSLGILGLRDELQEKVESTGEGQTKKSFPTAAIVFVGLGILLVGVSASVFFKGKKKLYNNEVDEKIT